MNTLISKNNEMREYRLAWKTILKNIAIAVTGIGLFAIAGKLIYSKTKENRFLFFFQKKQTTSEEKIRDIKDYLNRMTLPNRT